MSTFTYLPNIPQANQKKSATQAPIQSNFQAINELINQNHVGFYDSINYGKHTYTSLVSQGSSDVATSANEMAIYAKTSTDANGIELFYRYPSNGSVYQLTGGGTTSSGASASGYSYLTTTLLIKWGVTPVNTTGSTTVNFPTGGGIPAFTTSVYLLNYSPSANYTMTASGGYINTINVTSFVFHAPTGTFSNQIYWFAIGI